MQQRQIIIFLEIILPIERLMMACRRDKYERLVSIPNFTTTIFVIVVVLLTSCRGEDTFLLTILNSLDSTEQIRGDLAGDTRVLGIGGYTEFRSVSAGTHIISVDSATCSGVVRDTLGIQADTVFSYEIWKDTNTGSCELNLFLDTFRSVTLTGP